MYVIKDKKCSTPIIFTLWTENTLKLVYKDHSMDQLNVVLMHRSSLYAGSIVWKIYTWGPVKCGLYKQVVYIQVVFREGLTVQHILCKGRKVPVLYSNSVIIYNMSWINLRLYPVLTPGKTGSLCDIEVSGKPETKNDSTDPEWQEVTKVGTCQLSWFLSWFLKKIMSTRTR